MSEKEKKEDRAAKLEKATRSLQKKAAQINAALSMTEQEDISLRIEERKTARPDLVIDDIINNGTKKDIAKVFKNGTPEEKTILFMKLWNMEKTFGECLAFSKDAISFSTTEEYTIFTQYIKLSGFIESLTEKILRMISMYEVEIGYLSKLIDKYEAVQKDIVVYEILYGSRLMRDHTGMSYNITDRDKKNMKRLDDTTPEALLAEINEKHKNDGVVFRANAKGDLQWGTLQNYGNVTLSGYINTDKSGTLVADINYKGGLYDQIREQAKECETYLSYVKAYIEAINEYLEKYYYYAFAPTRLGDAINLIKEEDYSRSIIAKEYHYSYINDKRNNGEEITELEEYEAFVPDYREVVPDKDLKAKCVKYMEDTRHG